MLDRDPCPRFSCVKCGVMFRTQITVIVDTSLYNVYIYIYERERDRDRESPPSGRVAGVRTFLGWVREINDKGGGKSHLSDNSSNRQVFEKPSLQYSTVAGGT